MRDNLFQSQEQARDFTFNESVAAVFDDMLDRSIPFYREVQRMVVELGTQFAEPDRAIYDIGCSTGTTLAGLAQAIPEEQSVRLIGIEPAPAMRDKATMKFAAGDQQDRIEILPDPIEGFDLLPDARVIIMLYTLQFVRPIHRNRVLRMCWKSLDDGGCMLIAEKILADNSMLSRTYIDLYHDYKIRAGYTGTEIARKREALENVLIPYRDSENRTMLHEAGFTVVDQIFRWYNFALYIALKVLSIFFGLISCCRVPCQFLRAATLPAGRAPPGNPGTGEPSNSLGTGPDGRLRLL